MKYYARLVLAALGAVASLLPAHAAQYDQRLLNLSTRARVGTGEDVMITGFVIQDGAPKQILLRAVGPRIGTAPFNVGGTLSDPILRLYNGAGALVLTNDNWSSSDAATMGTVGAFPLTSGSRDAALVATLSPGIYTAQVSGANDTSGVALLELYDVTGSARLMNLSTRARVGSGDDTFFGGLVVAPSTGGRHLLIRAVGPGLRPLGVDGVVSDPAFAILNQVTGQTIAGGANDNWDSSLRPIFEQAGAFPLTEGSRDAAMVIDLMPGNYVVQASGVGGAQGVVLVEIYDLSPDTLSTVSVTATVAATDTINLRPATFTFNRIGPVNAAVTVAYTVSGTAVSGTDYEPLSGTVTFPIGVSTVNVQLQPKANAANTNNRTLTLALTPDKAYGIGAAQTASVSIFASQGSLFVSNLRTTSAAASSTAFGTATILLSPDETFALVNVTFANLSSPETSAHLVLDGNFISNVPRGQVSNYRWNLAPVGTYTTADLIAALRAGRVSVSLDTAVYPSGELAGTFTRSDGSAVFNPPAAPPAVDLATISSIDAARFLTQATFGATSAEIDGLKAQGYNAWLNNQMALSASLHLPAAEADMAAFGQGVSVTVNEVTTPNARISGNNRQATWWKLSTDAPDQLRQRMAFALSEIFVISDLNGTVGQWQNGVANYYDIFVGNAFGNYRDVLKQVTLSPMMGIYLSSLRSAKAANGTTPDENYAREVMQLFTIGLNELNPDGTLRLDINGQPIPTYTQETIVQMAKAFTGWSYNNTTPNAGATSSLFRGGTADYLNPMMLWPAFHDDTVKTIVGGKVLPAAQGGIKDLDDVIDALFNHPNTGPFIARQLIQRFVTSNPSPGYIYRVAQAFANNGAGVRGDLGAVLRAILLDYEARSSAVAGGSTFGKLKEPLLRGTGLFRAFAARSNSGRFNIPNAEGNLAQAAVRAPTVFNFFEPNYILPGAPAAAGLVAPEFQILTDATAISQPNFYYTYTSFVRSTTDMTQSTPALVYDPYVPLVGTPAQLVDAISLVLTASSLPTAARDRIVSALNSMANGTPATEKVRMATYLVLTSTHAAVQK